MNASLQTLNAVPEIQQLLQGGSTSALPLAKSISELVQQLAKQPESVIPIAVLSVCS
jgi:hypothetical protein